MKNMVFTCYVKVRKSFIYSKTLSMEKIFAIITSMQLSKMITCSFDFISILTIAISVYITLVLPSDRQFGMSITESFYINVSRSINYFYQFSTIRSFSGNDLYRVSDEYDTQ